MIVDINKIKPNSNNPRVIKDYKFQQLVKSVKEFPEMLKLRPIVVNKEMVVLGGNMRLKACQEAGLKEVPITIADKLTQDQEKEFIVKDNVGFGKWDWDVLANEWESDKLNDWGMDVWTEDVNLDDFFEDDESKPKEEKQKIILEYSDEDFEIITEKFNSLNGSKESIVWKLLIKE
ncbi:MAG: ParB N-terminal domain-containing protein [Pelagibacterales bacterium]|nr:ParB N-terminal domain-containing protein [Pelagibacterales bacterium]